MKKKVVVIAGGGTGGHIYPGLALAETLQAQDSQIEVHFVGAQGGLEEKIIPQSGHKLHLLKVGRLHRSVSLVRRVRALLLLPYSFIQSLFLYLRLRPLWVLGIGGFASGPFVFTASILGGKTAILEPNAFPGLANRWLSKVVDFCFVVFSETARFFPRKKVFQVGLPVRIKKNAAKLDYDGTRPFRVLIFGGSQGARAINKVVGDWVESLEGQASEYKIFHQVGSRDFEVWQSCYSSKHDGYLEYADYIDDMPSRLAWADLVICRAGIGSVAEVAMASRPTIFIPLPTAADNHQVKNAQVLVSKKAALMIEEKDLSWQKLGQTISELKSNPSELLELMNHLKEIDYSDAQEQILNVLMKE